MFALPRQVGLGAVIAVVLSSLAGMGPARAAEVPPGVPKGAEKATVSGHVDGDTFKVTLDGEGETIELLAVDAPESGECFAQEATDRLKELLPRRSKVYLERSDGVRDRRDSLRRYVWVVPEDGVKAYLLNTKLIREGFATYDARNAGEKYESNFEKAQRNADREKPGLWAACGGNHVVQRTVEQIRVDYPPLADVRELVIRTGGMLGQKISFSGTIRTIQVAGEGYGFELGDEKPRLYEAALQVEVAAPDGSTEYVSVGYNGDTAGMFEGTYVAVYGTVVDTRTGTNAFGGIIVDPLVAAELVELA